MFKKLLPFVMAGALALGGAAMAKDTFVTIGTGGITRVYYATGGALP